MVLGPAVDEVGENTLDRDDLFAAGADGTVNMGVDSLIVFVLGQFDVLFAIQLSHPLHGLLQGFVAL